MSRRLEDIEKAMQDLKIGRIKNPPQSEEEVRQYNRRYQALYRLLQNPDLKQKGEKIVDI